MKTKTIILFLSLSLLGASCNFFKKAPLAGVIKSVNGGADWQFSNAVKNNTSVSLASLNIAKLEFDPQNRETVYAGSYTGGLYKSEDSGVSWTKILSKIYVYDFAIHPFDPKTIYAAGFFADKGRVLKTIDGGSSWEEVYNEAGSENPVRAIAVNPQFPNQLMIGTSAGAVIKSADGGNSWQLANNFNDRTSRIIWQNGGVYALFKTKGLFKAQNFADNFRDLTAPLTSQSGSSFIKPNSIEAFSQFFVDPVSGSLIYLTTNIGPYKSADDGKTWTHIKLPVKSSESYARAIAIARGSSNIVLTSVGATVYKSTDGGLNWQTQGLATSGFVNYILIDPALPQIVYGGIYVNQ